MQARLGRWELPSHTAHSKQVLAESASTRAIMDSQENVTPTDTAGFKRRLSKQQQVQEQVQEQKRQRTENDPATPMIPTHPNTQRHASLHPRIQAMMVTQKGSGGSIHLVSRSEDYTSTYLGITAHWLDRGFHLKEVVLELVCVKQGSETGLIV